ncbi:hypothetical protein JO972_00640 [Verrucomicrobiaceae bacterium 5K15]|uniref:Uncharacterized protein n=1 Tax=Oceaniferula flava TaxID=2800421 RepID=A0AAE2S976_9BACT|nr:hypothetical protein [Oceaniferula flavus]MBK1853456.1 hypothetical protein [Oceaniferula flavus]MBM1134761.1 hypothetical protein [Oceaniferula flavus]
MRFLIFFLLIFSALAGGVIYFLTTPSSPLYLQRAESEKPAPIPDPETYAVTVEEIRFHREKLSRQYQQASTEAERKEVLASARSLLELTMPSLMRCWLGTPWDFNGTASAPGGGKVACGYYVSTIMRDSGFEVQRIRLAQQPSQNILLTFLPRKKLSIRVGMDYEDFMQSMREKEHGIYIIGLDKHVGFLVHNEQGLQFLHSGGVLRRVVDENQDDAYSIQASNYRVVGNICADDAVLIKWLRNEPFPTHL